MSFKNLSVLTISLFFSLNLYAANNEIQKERFDEHLKDLKSAFVDSSGDNRTLNDVVNSMLRGTKRVSAYNLQALGRVYTKFSKDGKSYRELFRNTIRFEFKSIEDAIGEVKQQMEHLSDPEIKKSKQIQHEMYKAAAIEVMKFVLTGKESFLKGKIPENFEKPDGKKVVVEDALTPEGQKVVKKFKRLSDKNYSDKSLFWNKSWFPYTPDSKLQKLSQALFTFSWDSYKNDRAFLLSELSSHLEELSDSDYDLKLLENGPNDEKGLHELRREIRWFSFQAGVLNGTVNLDDGKQCPIKDYKDIVNDPDLINSMFTKIPQTPFPQQEVVCKIPKCLYFKMSEAIDDLGDLKDKSKKYNRKHNIKENITPKKYRKKADKIYDDMIDNKLFKEVAKVLRSCI